MKIIFSAYTNKGSVRDNNEDAFLTPTGTVIQEGGIYKEIEVNAGSPYLFGVADGMGGHEKGEVASNYSLNRMNELIIETFLSKNCRIEQWLRKLVFQVHNEINEKAAELHAEGMGTTISLLYVYNDQIYQVHAGDSCIFRYRGGYLQKVSTDHTVRELTGDKNVPSNMIYSSLGGSKSVTTDIKEIIPPDGTFLLMSDGVSDILSVEEMENFMKTTDVMNLPETFVYNAIEKGSKDNCTAIMCKISR